MSVPESRWEITAIRWSTETRKDAFKKVGRIVSLYLCHPSPQPMQCSTKRDPLAQEFSCGEKRAKWESSFTTDPGTRATPVDPGVKPAPVDPGFRITTMDSGTRPTHGLWNQTHLSTDPGTRTTRLQTQVSGLFTCGLWQQAYPWTLASGLPRISGRVDWWRDFPAKASLWRLEEVTTSLNVQAPMQDYKNHEESGKHDNTKGKN